MKNNFYKLGVLSLKIAWYDFWLERFSVTKLSGIKYHLSNNRMETLVKFNRQIPFVVRWNYKDMHDYR